jgi:microcin C transport system substrate-binding protein
MIASVLFFLAAPVRAEELFPGKNWKPAPNPMASTLATVGGEISIYLGPSPKSLNYYLENSSMAAQVFGTMYETLLTTHPLTLDNEPGLAERWSVSDDKMTFTFWLDPKAKWSDGKPVTAEDVQWTFDAIMAPKNLTGVHKVAFERFDRPVVVDGRTVRFHVKEVHWRNLLAAGGFHILPKHAFEKLDFNKINFGFPVVSGPYKVGEFKEGMALTMVRRTDYWNAEAPGPKNTGNFEKIRYRFFQERENAFEAFLKGEIDLYPVYTARQWVNETKGEKFEKNWIVRQAVHNKHPVGFQGFAMNMRRPPFDDIRARRAMAHLVDRKKMNSTLMYDQYFLHRSYYEDLYDEKNPCPNPLFDFDKEKARKLLAEAGWAANPKTGKLEKGGKPFVFRVLNRDQTSDKFLAIFAEDLKDAGITMVVDQKDWAAWVKDMDEHNFDMTWAAWGAGVYKDPEPMWASAEADRPGGNNYCGFKDPKVDALIEKQKREFDVEARHAIVREIDQMVYAQAPYVLLWNIGYTRLLYWNKFGTPDWVLSKYGTEESAEALWWYDEDTAAELAGAMRDKAPLPARPDPVKFDQVFKPQAR